MRAPKGQGGEHTVETLRQKDRVSVFALFSPDLVQKFTKLHLPTPEPAERLVLFFCLCDVMSG